MKLKENKGMTLIVLTIILAVLVVGAGGVIVYLLNNPTQITIGTQNSETIEAKIGQYIEYDVNYQDMYSSINYGKKNGWRYLGEDDNGNKLLISTGIPIILEYNYLLNDIHNENPAWWDKDVNLEDNIRFVNGLLNNMENIPYTKVGKGDIFAANRNTAVGLFEGQTRKYGNETYTVLGDKFVSKKYSSKIENVRTLTLEELNRAVNAATNGKRAETSTEAGFKDLTEESGALGLFDMSDLKNYGENYWYYFIATTFPDSAIEVYFVCSYPGFPSITYDTAITNHDKGIRPVIVLSSEVQFIDANNDGILEIK